MPMLYRIQSTALGQSGNTLQILPGASVTVLDKNGALARIYADAGEVTELPNPTTADSAGGYDLYLAYDDYYDVSITLNGQTVDDRIYPIEIGLGARVAEDAGTATTQAGVATTQAGISTAQAGISTAQAVIATTKAGEAAGSAAGAATSEANAALFDGPRFDTIAAAAAYASYTDGGFAIVSPTDETFQYDAASTATADGALIVDATGMGVGRLISKRAVFASFSQFIADTRTFTAGTTLTIPSIGAVYQATAGAGNLGRNNAGGQAFDVVDTGFGLSLLHFGGVGNGVADNLSAFNAFFAHDAAVLHVPQGVFLVSSGILVTRSAKVIGEGYESLVKSSGTDKSVFYGTALSDVEFVGLRIEGNQTGLGNAALGLGGFGVQFYDSQNVKVDNCYFDYFGILPVGTASYASPILVKGGCVIVTNSFFGENSYNVTGSDISVNQTTDTIVSNNISKSECDSFVSLAATSNASGSNVVRHTITGNIAKRVSGSNARSGILTTYAGKPSYVSITGNVIEGFSWNAIYIQAADLSGATTQDSAGTVITGNTIRFCGGGSTIAASVYLSGIAGSVLSANLIRDTGYNSDGTTRAFEAYAIRCTQNTSNATITGNTVVNSALHGISVVSQGSGGGIRDVVISGNSVRGCVASSILLKTEGAASAIIERVVVSDNTVAMDSVAGHGIQLTKSGTGLMIEVSVLGNIVTNTATSPTGYGIYYFTSAFSGSVANNRFRGFSSGIHFISGLDRDIPSITKVSGNHIEDCAQGFFGGNKVAIEFGNTYKNVTTVYGFRSYGGRPISDDGTGNLLVEYVDTATGPVQGDWFRGDRIILDTPSVDGSNMVKLGRVCTASGTFSTSTWVDQYISTVSPAA